MGRVFAKAWKVGRGPGDVSHGGWEQRTWGCDSGMGRHWCSPSRGRPMIWVVFIERPFWLVHKKWSEMGKSGSTKSREATAKVSQENDDGGPGYQWHWSNQRSLLQTLVHGKDGGERGEGEKGRKTPRGLAGVCPGAIESDEEITQGVLFLEHVKLIPALGSSGLRSPLCGRFFPQLLVRSHRREHFHRDFSILTTLSTFLGWGRRKVWGNTDFVRESQN